MKDFEKFFEKLADAATSMAEARDLALKAKKVIENKNSKQVKDVEGYEILSFKCNIKQWSEIWEKQNGTFHPNLQWKERYCLEMGFDIHSVKRIRDGEIFSIGDICSHAVKITGFEIYENTIKVLTKVVGDWQFLNALTKVKEDIRTPIFKSFDGVEYFSGERKDIWGVHTKDGENAVGAYHADVHPEFYEALRPHYEYYFSTKQNADNWILENKPCLSLNDLLSVWDKGTLGEYMNGSKELYKQLPLYKKILSLAKEKLKL